MAGAIFTLPALYTLGLDPHPAQTIFICLAGGCLGVLFLIPLRRYFVRETHGEFPYPEATAITEVLVTGERGGSQARLLLQATALAGVYDFFVTTFQIFRGYVRFIGVGAIATAGIFGIIKSLRIVAASFAIAARAFRHGERRRAHRSRHPGQAQLIGVVVAGVAVAAFFGTLSADRGQIALALVLTLVFSFFFTSVAATAIATIARNPVSGMTMLTVIISSVVLLRFGVSGQTGMFFVMAIAGMVCTALSVSGQTITDLKTGYWLGSTPAVQERVKFLGVVASAAAVGLAIVMLAQAFQFGEAVPGDTRAVLAAPQASIMQALVAGLHEPPAGGVDALQRPAR